MIISFDIHGVIDTYTDIFKKTMLMSRSLGVDVYVLTGPPEKEAKAELDELGLIPGFHYDGIISVVDWLKKTLPSDAMWQDDNGEWWCDDEDWWNAKAKICVEYDIFTHYDDSVKYLAGWDNIGCLTKFMLVKNEEVEELR